MRKLTAIFLLCLFVQLANAETFVVTSNADSGPGTLREAIEKANANGTIEADSIAFHLPGNSTVDKTIVIQSTLPPFSGNLVIDGTSQPGGFFGISNTKVILHGGVQMCAGIEIISASNIAIYGIWFQGFEYINNLTDYCHGVALFLNGVSNLTIGKPGRGNAFSTQSSLAIVHKSYLGGDFANPNIIADNIWIENNIFGLNTAASGIEAGLKQSVYIDNGRNLTINGNTGNGDFSLGSAFATGNGFIRFTNNNFADPFGSTGVKGSLAVAVQGVYGTSAEYELVIASNRITNNSQYCIILWDLTGEINIYNNQLGAYFPIRDSTDDSFCIGMIRCKPTNAGQIVGNTMVNRKKGLWAAGCGKLFLSSNSIYCTGKGISIEHPVAPIPFISIREITASSLSGITAPHAKVELYYTDSCRQLCENGQIFQTTGFADAAGRFTFPIDKNGAYSVTAIQEDSTTSEFNGVKVSLSLAQVNNATCGEKNGSITGLKIYNASAWYWEDEAGTVVGNDTSLFNLGQGRYRMVLRESNVSCPTLTPYFTVEAFAKPVIDPSHFSVSQPTCGQANGNIRFAGTLPMGAALKWNNVTGDIVQDYGDQMNNLPPGEYFCKIYLYDDSTCHTFYGPIKLTNQSGPALDSSGIQIARTICDNKNGSITGITATNVSGTPQLWWVDSANNVVGYTFDLQNVGPGRYRLKFKDEGGCDTLISPFYTVGNTGSIAIDTTTKMVKPANCSGTGGSIRNIKITGAETYVWTNTVTGATVGSTAEVSNLASGTYQLTATNPFGCSQTTGPFAVPQTSFIRFDARRWEGIHANCNQPNGQITLDPVYIYSDTSQYTFRWIDSVTGGTAGNHVNLYNIYGGTYLQLAKDSNGCEEQVMKMTIQNKPLPSFDYTTLKVTPDQCLASVGAIQGLAVKDLWGITVSYTWVNANDVSVGSTLPIQNLPADSYRLKVTNMGCTVISQPVVVPNVNVTLNNPQYDEQVILKNTATTLQVKNPQPGTYQLFDTPSATMPLQQNATGIFTTPLLTADKTYYVQYVNGVCASERVGVKIKVVNKTAVYVPTAFSPNSDGKNDLLKAIPVGKVKLIRFTVYDRWGGVVFSTSNFSLGWNGTYGGKLLETGVYVWTLNAVDELTGKTLAQKGTVMVIR